MSFRPISQAVSLMIKNSTEQIILLKQQLTEIKKMIEVLTKDYKAVKTLEQYKGIGIMTASILYAEIVDIRRFAKDDNLASYAGLVKYENNLRGKKTG